MLFNLFTTTALVACSLLAAPALGSPLDITLPPGLESHLTSRASDVTVKYWKTTSCKTSNSEKSYNSGKCLNVASVDHAVSMQERKKNSCHLIRYEEKDCKGYSEKGLNLDDCFNIGDRWESLKIQC
ncbi:hypothetical protein B0I35DRAFT_444135 [Stachybotrys elegans]|uniref:Uncharacterized protein n=1 Tax=Stachybotrys elegans TaxID=80388 RepID=A0A8K0SFQ7_9HYPO|nr:hypothetical protein B0I35DRAFT_444135 [Stachybotrys elegans]